MGAAALKRLWVVSTLVFLLGLGGWSEGCWEQEKLGLLQLKPFFNLQPDLLNIYYQYALYNWVEDEGKESSDCCKWDRVECDATTGRVIGLSLANTLVQDPFLIHKTEIDTRQWSLNASLFLPFEELKSLSLSGNQIAGCLDNAGFEKLAPKLKKLEFLDLSLNNFNDGSILSSLVEFPSLKSLNLSYNQLNGSTHTSGLGGLSKKLSTIEIIDLQGNQLNENILVPLSEISSIKYLDLSSNHFTAGSIHRGFKRLSRLRSLETLNLSNNDLNNNILSNLGDISSLKTLALQNCGLNGTIDIQELNNLTNLKELDLGHNEIMSLGSFHDKDESRRSGLINLEVIALTFNILNNSILSSLGPFSKFLKHLHIVYDTLGGLEGSIDIKDAGDLKDLKSSDVLAVNNSILLRQSLSLFPSLKTLHFVSNSDSSFNASEILKRELRNFTNLEELNVENYFLPINFIEDVGELTSLRVLLLNSDDASLPIQDICQLTLLEKLVINQNILKGVLPDCFSNLTSLAYLDLSSNQIFGNLTTSPLQSLKSIEYIDLSNNQFRIPSSLKPFFYHSKLKYFHGDNNDIYAETELHSLTPQFQLKAISLSCCGDVGPLPEFLLHQHELESVDLSNINLTGEFPSWLLANNTQLERLFLNNNSLSGNFRLPFHSPMKLFELDVSDNFFDGQIPTEIGVCLPGLRSLNISINYLDGRIPISIGDMKLLQRLDLSENRLSSVIPDNLAIGCSFLEFLDLSNNRLRGQIFSTKFNLEKLNELYLVGNNFTGTIPNSLSNCLSLSKMDLGYNNLSGRFPRWIGNLSSLQILSMPNNHFEGPIPMEICQLNIKVLDLSMNNLSGMLPSCFSPPLINHVHLSKNRLQGLIPNGICKSSNLVTLDLSDNQLTGNVPDCIGNLSSLSYVVLKHNSLEGEISKQFCQLGSLSLIDLSHNNFSGHIPNCLNVTGDPVFASMPIRLNTYIETDGSIEMSTKNRSYSYKGRILIYLSGVDLSSNKLTGEIPYEMGNFHKIVMLNLSHNSLSGSIPQSLSKLKEIESLDLSYNNLSGTIPFQFVELYSLAYFNVSYNNLSGRPPPRTAQFATDFDENSYWGNPFLCGEPMPKNCSTLTEKPTEDGENVGLIDMKSFYVTFIVSYMIVLLSIAAVLYINPYWRRAWFYFIERCINS